MTRILIFLVWVFLVNPVPRLSGQARRLRSAARPEATVGGTRIELTAYAWLNLQPGLSPDLPDSSARPSSPPMAPLHVVTRIRSMTGRPLPRGLRSDSAFVLWDRRSCALALVPQGASDTSIAARVWGGPRWLLDADSLDVIVRVRAPGQRDVYLRAPRVVLVRAF